MAADLFETYAVTIVATMVYPQFFQNDLMMMVYPLTIGRLYSYFNSWHFFVRLGSSKNIMLALYKGFVVTAITSLLVLYPLLIMF